MTYRAAKTLSFAKPIATTRCLCGRAHAQRTVRRGADSRTRTRARPIAKQVKFPDDSVKTFLLDESQPVSALIATICSHLQLERSEELGLLVEMEEDELELRLQPTARRQAFLRRTVSSECLRRTSGGSLAPEDAGHRSRSPSPLDRPSGELHRGASQTSQPVVVRVLAPILPRTRTSTPSPLPPACGPAAADAARSAVRQPTEEDTVASARRFSISARQYTRLQQRLTRGMPTTSGLAHLLVNEIWLNVQETLPAQYVTESQVLVLKYRFFHHVMPSRRDPVRLNMLFINARAQYLRGECVMSPSSIAKFAAVLCQLLTGDFSAAKHTPSFLEISRKSLLPKGLKARPYGHAIQQEHQLLAGMPELDLKFCFVRLWTTLDSFGLELLTCIRTSDTAEGTNGQRGLLAVGQGKIALVTSGMAHGPETYSFTALERWTRDPVAHRVTIYVRTESLTRALVLVLPDMASILCDCLQGNVELIAAHRAGMLDGTRATYASDEFSGASEQFVRYTSSIVVPDEGRRLSIQFNQLRDEIFWADHVPLDNPLFDGSRGSGSVIGNPLYRGTAPSISLPVPDTEAACSDGQSDVRAHRNALRARADALRRRVAAVPLIPRSHRRRRCWWPRGRIARSHRACLI